MSEENYIENLQLNRNDLLYIGILLAISIVVFCLHPFARDLWVLDEVRYGETVRSMIETGNFFTPHINGEIYPDKPPLFFWYLMIFTGLSGSIASSVFFIATSITGIACVIAAYFLGRLAFDRETALIGCVIMAASFLFLGIAQFVRMDLLMLLFMLLAFHFFCKGYLTRRRRLYYLIYIFLSLSILTKGPLGFFIVMASIIAYLIHKKDAREILRLKLPQGIGIVILITGLWLLLTIWESGTAYIENVWKKQLVGRAVKSWIHEQKFYYYLLWLPLAFLPWTAYLPRAFAKMWKNNNGFGRLMIWWVITAIIILSAISYKIFIYILLFIPALALMTGAILKKLIFDKDKTHIITEHLITACLLLLAGLAALFPWLLYRMAPSSYIVQLFPFAEHQYLSKSSSLLPVAVLCGASACVVLVLGILRRHKYVIISLVLFMAALSNTLAGFVIPKLNGEMSPKKFCEKIKQYHEKGFTAAAYEIEFGILNYYAGINMKRPRTLEEMQEILNKNPRTVIAITGNHWDLNKHRMHTVDLTNKTYITGRSPQRTYYLLVQDGEKLKPLVDAITEYRRRGYALARYKNNLTLLDRYLGEEIPKLHRKRELKLFRKQHPKAAIIVDDYWLKRNPRHMKKMKITTPTPFAGKTYYLLLNSPSHPRP